MAHFFEDVLFFDCFATVGVLGAQFGFGGG